MSNEEKEEVTQGLQQSASCLILRCWMEVRKIFILYLYTSSTSPYHPSEAIFSRDEYQSDTGNLPHIHLMISLDVESMSVEQKNKMSEYHGTTCQLQWSDWNINI